MSDTETENETVEELAARGAREWLARCLEHGEEVTVMQWTWSGDYMETPPCGRCCASCTVNVDEVERNVREMLPEVEAHIRASELCLCVPCHDFS